MLPDTVYVVELEEASACLAISKTNHHKLLQFVLQLIRVFPIGTNL